MSQFVFGIPREYAFSIFHNKRDVAQLFSKPLLQIVIVIPEECEHGLPILDWPQEHCDRARAIFLKPLIDHPQTQVYGIGAYFVHTKVTIIDDIFATIGSANMNRRGLTHDSEINAFILDGRIGEGYREFACDLRIRLWAEHLGMPLTQGSFNKLSNIDTALDLMRNKRPRTSRLIRYTLKNPGTEYPVGWDTVSDPEGS